ncbi:MAG: bifunctional 2-acylglycerophosphoethanolamine acyltransferase/acyl-ACP synthetase [Gammaproteobacteria bacterium]|nr:MAG: bifunctional 2-acylglycerophosphoethanolamine acyltransferase/acyl-ACP synthetase [Gammaproteobacteria bacterium]
MVLGALKFLIKLLFRVEIKGDYQGGQAHGHDKTLVIANHSSFLDAILLMLFLPDKPVFVIHKESERSRFYRYFLRYADYVTVDTSHPMPMRRVIHTINSGRTVVFFPEGRVTVTGTLMKLYSGAAFAALKTDATLIPIQINGTKFSYFSRLSKILTQRLFPKVGLTIFPPTKLSAAEELDRDKQLNRGREEMHHLMMEMSVQARERMTLFEMLVDARDKFGKERFAFRDGLSDDLTYGDVVTKSVSLSVLLQRKMSLSKRVGILLPNSNACLLAFYAMQHSGHTPVMLNYTAGERAVNAGLKAAEVTTVLTSRRFVKKSELQPLIDAMQGYDIVYLEDLRKQVGVADKLHIAVKRMMPLQTMAEQTPEREALVLFTSGTEGLPKGVLHSHDSLMTQLQQIKAIYDFTPQDNFMLCLPVFHVFGLMGAFCLPISTGASGVLYPTPLHYKVIPETIYENGCTVLLSTSTFLAGYARFAESYDFHTLRYVIAGAEKLSAEVRKVYGEKFGIRVMEGYGATETAPVISAETVMSHHQGTVGRIIPGMIAELVPVEGIDHGGRLVLHGDNVMMGYLHAENPGVLDRPEIGQHGRPVYDTGDIVYIDDNRFVYLVGRVKRFAKIAGEMVSLDTVEQMARHASPEAQHAAITASDRKKGESIHLFTTDAELTRKQLQNATKVMGVPKLAVPKHIHATDNIPVFASGKVNYPALSELLEEESHASPSSMAQNISKLLHKDDKSKDKDKDKTSKQEAAKSAKTKDDKDNKDSKHHDATDDKSVTDNAKASSTSTQENQDKETS